MLRYFLPTLIGSALVGAPAYGGTTSIDADTKQATILTMDTDRTFVISGMIGDESSPIVNEIQETVLASTAPLVLLLDSPGGKVTVGLSIIAALRSAQATGVSVYCVAAKDTSSMAFNIWSLCSKRFAFKESNLMFHQPGFSVAVGGRLTLEEVTTLTKSLQRITEVVDGQVFSSMQAVGITKEWFTSNSLKETKWTGSSLIAEPNLSKFFTLIDGVRWDEPLVGVTDPLPIIIPKGKTLAPKSSGKAPKKLNWDKYPTVNPPKSGDKK